VASLSSQKAQAACEAVWASFFKSPTAINWVQTCQGNDPDTTFEDACRKLMQAYRQDKDLKEKIEGEGEVFGATGKFLKAGVTERECNSKELETIEKKRSHPPQGAGPGKPASWYGRIERVASFAEKHPAEQRAVIGRHMLVAAAFAFDQPTPLRYLGNCLAGHFFMGQHQTGTPDTRVALAIDGKARVGTVSDGQTSAGRRARGYSISHLIRLLFWAVNGKERQMALDGPPHGPGKTPTGANGQTGFGFEDTLWSKYWAADRAIAYWFGDSYSLRGYFHSRGIGPMEAACRICVGHQGSD
jgi:hypothetical protein